VVAPGFFITHTDGRYQLRPLLADVPVLWPSAGGMTLRMPMRAGDPVLLVFAESGLEYWKEAQTAGLAGPAKFALKDAVAIPGFGPLDLDVPAGRGAYASLQSDNGATHVSVGPSEIALQTGNISLTLNSSGIRFQVGNQAWTMNSRTRWGTVRALFNPGG